MGLLHEIKTLNTQEMGLHVVTDEELVTIHEIFLEMIDDVKRVCDQYNIKWGIAGGCALGAVRHKGFIPWDDDVDLFISREDYLKFVKVYPSEKNPKYDFLCPGDKDYYAHIPRIFNTATTAEMIQKNKRGKGIYIELFVIDDTYDNNTLRFLHGIKCTVYLFIVSCSITRNQKDDLIKYGSKNLVKKVKFRSFFGKIFSYRPVEKWIEKAIKCFSKVNNNNSKYVVSTTGMGHYFHELYERDKMLKYKNLQFENRVYPFMIDTDYFCRMRYGDDYMQVPPENKREKHMYVHLDLNK